MGDLTLTDNFILLALSVFLFVYRLPVSKADKVCLFMSIFFPTSAFFFICVTFGVDLKVMTLGRI